MQDSGITHGGLGRPGLHLLTFNTQDPDLGGLRSNPMHVRLHAQGGQSNHCRTALRGTPLALVNKFENKDYTYKPARLPLS